MGSYRKRPVVIEAVQYAPNMERLPDGVEEVYDGAYTTAHIQTLEGKMIVSPGDWIITGVNGERYPCKPDIFAMTYEPADAPPAPAPARVAQLEEALGDAQLVICRYTCDLEEEPIHTKACRAAMAALDRCEALERELDEARGHLRIAISTTADFVTKLSAERDAARAEVERLRKLALDSQRHDDDCASGIGGGCDCWLSGFLREEPK